MSVEGSKLIEVMRDGFQKKFNHNVYIIIILYIYHAFINALSAHMIHINLNTIFYTHVEHKHQNNLHKVLHGKHTDIAGKITISNTENLLGACHATSFTRHCTMKPSDKNSHHTQCHPPLPSASSNRSNHATKRIYRTYTTHVQTTRQVFI